MNFLLEKNAHFLLRVCRESLLIRVLADISKNIALIFGFSRARMRCCNVVKCDNYGKRPGMIA
jgi:hypothetical protein